MDATDAMDIRKEPESVRASYGSKLGESSFANNCLVARRLAERGVEPPDSCWRSEEHTSELQSQSNLVCRLLLEKKNRSVEHTRPATSNNAIIIVDTRV